MYLHWGTKFGKTHPHQTAPKDLGHKGQALGRPLQGAAQGQPHPCAQVQGAGPGKGLPTAVTKGAEPHVFALGDQVR